MNFRYLRKEEGSALIGLLLAVVIIAAVFYGSSFFSQKKQSAQIYHEVKVNAEDKINNINKKTHKQQQEINNILNNKIASSTKEH